MARRSLWTVVKRHNAEGNLALFVGAGISMGCGLPSWEDSVSRVVAKAWKGQPDLIQLLTTDRNILSARYAKKKLADKFNEAVYNALYDGTVEISACVKAIAKSGIRQICNFNFDDLIAEALLTEGIATQVVAPGQPFDACQDEVIVYHPHGILPRSHDEKEVADAKIVFSEDDYHNLYSDPYSWANITQLSLLTSKSVLFIGLSMQDPNLRRLIDIARNRGFTNQHFAVFKDPVFGQPKSSHAELQKLKSLIDIDMKSLGITPWFVDSYDKLTEILERCRVVRAP
jgi:hypothetical protein